MWAALLQDLFLVNFWMVCLFHTKIRPLFHHISLNGCGLFQWSFFKPILFTVKINKRKAEQRSAVDDTSVLKFAPPPLSDNLWRESLLCCWIEERPWKENKSSFLCCFLFSQMPDRYKIFMHIIFLFQLLKLRSNWKDKVSK